MQDKAKQASHPNGIDAYVEWVRVAALTQYSEILAFPERDKILQDKAKQASHPDGVDTYVEWVRVAALTQYCEILAFQN